MKSVLLFVHFMFFSGLLAAQNTFTVSGKVIDSASREPLAFASVFCQNTTQGTATNKEGAFALSLKEGGYDLVITFTGYQPQQIRISPDITRQELLIELIKEDGNWQEAV